MKDTILSLKMITVTATLLIGTLSSASPISAADLQQLFDSSQEAYPVEAAFAQFSTTSSSIPIPACEFNGEPIQDPNLFFVIVGSVSQTTGKFGGPVVIWSARQIANAMHMGGELKGAVLDVTKIFESNSELNDQQTLGVCSDNTTMREHYEKSESKLIPELQSYVTKSDCNDGTASYRFYRRYKQDYMLIKEVSITGQEYYGYCRMNSMAPEL